MEPGQEAIAALREVAYLLERANESSRRASAFRRAAHTLEQLDAGEWQALAGRNAWTSLPGIGDSTAGVIGETLAGGTASYLARLRAAKRPLAAEGSLREALRGDLHSHTQESDGSVPLEEMAQAAADLGHEYLAITDHSPRLRIANGLSVERLTAQLDHIARYNEIAPLRVLTGIEVDILSDGRLDQRPDLLAGLDVVVASVHSELRMPSDQMTLRMVAAVANPVVDVLGHCTGRLVAGERGTRAPSSFDAEVVFEACRQFGVAVEINCRPERSDPPDDLLALAAEMGCDFSLNTDAHAPGQLEFVAYGVERAESAGITAGRIITTWPLQDLLGRTRR
ncbi:MAG: PHP domain-containing protein [Propionicimonas sp.]